MTSEAPWRQSRRKRVEAAAIAAIGYRVIACLGATLRWRTDGLAHLARIQDEGRQPVMAFWHGRILPATYYFRRRGISVLTSENFDGEWIAGIIERFGFEAVRGSSSRGGARALLEVKRAMALGHAAGFTVDGPRGPACSVQPGAVWLAKATGNPLLPFHLEASRFWSVKSWDRTQVPRPFTTVALAIGEPIEVPPEADEASLEDHRRALEQALHACRMRALEMVARETA